MPMTTAVSTEGYFYECVFLTTRGGPPSTRTSSSTDIGNNKTVYITKMPMKLDEIEQDLPLLPGYRVRKVSRSLD